MNPRIQRLRAEIAAVRVAFEERVAEITRIELGSAAATEGDLARAALALHHAYGAVESALARIARTIEGDLPDGPDWHQALLADMGLELEGLRPPVLQPATVASLRQLLAFRHFLRHAYAVRLDPTRLVQLQRVVIDAAPALARDLADFDAFLSALGNDAS